MKNVFANETNAIRTLRDRHPHVGQMTLAKRIEQGFFPTAEDKKLSNVAASRPLLSTYSVIRRYDAAKAQTQVAGLGN